MYFKRDKFQDVSVMSIYEMLKEGKSNKDVMLFIEEQDLKQRKMYAKNSKTKNLMHFDLTTRRFIALKDEELELKIKNNDILKIVEGSEEKYILNFFKREKPLFREVVELFNGDHLKFFSFLFAEIISHDTIQETDTETYHLNIQLPLYDLIRNDKLTIEEITEFLDVYDYEWNVIKLKESINS